MGTLTTIVKLETEFIYDASLADYEAKFRSPMPDLDLRWPDGTGTSQADRAFCDYGVTLANGATRSLDLRSLTDAAAVSISMVEVRYMRIRCRDYALTFAKGAANGWTGLGSAWTVTIPAGMWVLMVVPTNGLMATTASDKVIDISNASGQTATYDIEIIGVSA